MVTIQLDAMGYLHVWAADGQPIKTGKYTYEIEGKEADLYIQSSADVKDVLNDLLFHERNAVQSGQAITTPHFNIERL